MAQHPDEVQRFLAQQDATRPSVAREGQTNPLALLAETGVDFTPIVGDIKALLVDAPRSFREGHPILGTVDVLSAVPILGLPFDFFRKAVRTGMDVTRAAGRGARNVAASAVPGLERFERLMDRGLERTVDALTPRRTLNAIDAGMTRVINALPGANRGDKMRTLKDIGEGEGLDDGFRQIMQDIELENSRSLSSVADEILGPVEILPPQPVTGAQRRIQGMIDDRPPRGPERRVIDQSTDLARSRTQTPERRAIESGRRDVDKLKEALDFGDKEKARKLARELVERNRRPLPPGS